MTLTRLHAGAALVFAASAALTVIWCGSMSAMPGMEMPGGWSMSMAWMRMPGQGWLGYSGMFMGMWAVMMVAMMMPALVPMLAEYRRTLPRERLARLTLCVAAGYFAVWCLFGALLMAPGLWFNQLAMRVPEIARAVPLLAGTVILLAGAWQLTRGKQRQLASCRHTLDCCREPRPNYRDAWSHGLRIGLRCVYCCANLTAVLLVIGVMDLLAMALVTMAISAERLARASRRMEFVLGAVLVAAGLVMCVRALMA